MRSAKSTPIGNLSEELFIFERMAAGDQHAFRFFFDKYYNDLCNYVNLYLHNRSASEDIVQDLLDRELIEQGEDKKGKFYKVYYQEEN